LLFAKLIAVEYFMRLEQILPQLLTDR